MNIFMNLIIGGLLKLLSFLVMFSSKKSTHLGGGVLIAVGESFFKFSAESLVLLYPPLVGIREPETDGKSGTVGFKHKGKYCSLDD